MIEIKRASELGEDAKQKISEVFVDAFGKDLTFFSKDRKKLAKAFEHMFIDDVFYCAFVDGEIAGITACITGERSSVRLNNKELRKHLGFYKGILASIFLKSEFEKPPFEVGEGIASVEFVATTSKYRGKGVATALMNSIFSFPQYSQYVIEVADTNTNAVKLYEKLGYKEIKRMKPKHSKKSGINYLVYMKYVKSSGN